MGFDLTDGTKRCYPRAHQGLSQQKEICICTTKQTCIVNDAGFLLGLDLNQCQLNMIYLQ